MFSALFYVICVCMNVLTFNIQCFVLYYRNMYEFVFFLTFNIQCFILCDMCMYEYFDI